MAKKRYNVVLEEESKEIVSKHFAKLGMSFSGFLNLIIEDMAREIKGQPMVIGNKDVGELTLNEFGELTSYWMKKAAEYREE